MGKFSGAVLILAGLGLGAYTLVSGRDSGPEIGAPHGGGIAKTPGVVRAGLAHAPPPALPPSVPETAPPAKPDIPAIVPPPPAFRPAAPRAVRIAETPLRVPVGEVKSAAGPPLDRAALTRSIQRELRRIGCYRGQVTGLWTPAVRQAMKAFTNRVNASLPVDRPDAVLLAMVQGQEPGACSASCPAGQGRAADGRCLPKALVADSGKPAMPRTAASEAASAGRAKPAQADPGHATAPPPEGRMSLAGPPAAARRAETAAGRPRATRRHARAPRHTRTAGVRSQQRARPAYLPFGGYPMWVPFGLP